MRPPVVVLPPGDPQALTSTARALHDAAVRTGTGGQRLAAQAQGLADGWTWCGPRSSTYTADSATLTQQSLLAAEALEAAAEAVLAYARELEVAQGLARAAQQHAGRVDAATTTLEWRLVAADAAVRSTTAAADSVAGPPSGRPYPQARAADQARAQLASLQREADGLRLEVQGVQQQVQAVEELVAAAERALSARLSAVCSALDRVAVPASAPAPPKAHHWYDGVLHQAEGLATGLYDGVAEPVAMVGGLVGIGADAGDAWKGLAAGLEHGVTHPLDLAKAAVDWQDLAEGDYGHWVGELGPSLAAALFTGGAAAGVRGAEGVTALTAVERTTAGVDRVLQEGAATERATESLALTQARMSADFGDEFGHTLPSEKARQFQTGDRYPGQDAWVDRVAKADEKFWVGEPFPGQFVVPDSEIPKVGTSARDYYEGVQVGPLDRGAGPRYRDGGLAGYVVKKPFPRAEAVAEANPHFGDGGLAEWFLPKDIPALEREGYIQRVDLHPLPDDLDARFPEAGRPINNRSKP